MTLITQPSHRPPIFRLWHSTYSTENYTGSRINNHSNIIAIAIRNRNPQSQSLHVDAHAVVTQSTLHQSASHYIPDNTTHIPCITSTYIQTPSAPKVSVPSIQSNLCTGFLIALQKVIYMTIILSSSPFPHFP